MRSPAFGYARAGHVSEQSVQDLQIFLTAYAECEGYALAEVFIEQEDSGSSAFAALIDALSRSGLLIVVVPSMCHFASLPGLRIAMKDLIERETGARVVAIDSACPCASLAAG